MKYEYASITALRDYQKTFDTDTLKKLIRLYSDRVNRLTAKEYIASQKTVRVTLFNQLIKLSGSPIMKINTVTALYPDGSTALLDTSNYILQENNLIQVKNLQEQGVEALEINYIAGCMEGAKEFQVELISPIRAYEVQARLKDASGLEERDVLVFGNTVIIINLIDYASNTIYFDVTGNIPTIPQGAKTICYGQVPLQIEEAIKLFVKHHKKLQGFSGRITSERIGKSYSYDSTGLDNTITGIAEIDSILFLFINDDFDILFL